MKKSYVIFCLFILFSSYSQQVQFAHKIIKYSTDLGGKQNGIKRILGKPDAFSQGGSSPNAWSPKNALDGYEFVEVGFENAQSVKQIAIFENINAGCVVKVGVDTGNGKYQTVWSRKKDWKTPNYKSTLKTDRDYYFGRKRRKIYKSPETNRNPGIEYIILDNAISNVVSVRVEFNFALVPGQKQIDAIGISSDVKPIEVQINTDDKFQRLDSPKILNLGLIEPTNPTISSDGRQLYVSCKVNEKDEVFSFTKDQNGNWSNKQLEPNLSLNRTYNYIEYVGKDFILKGGLTYTRISNQTGFEFIETNNYNVTKPIQITSYTNYDEYADATITPDGKIIIMALETDFTQGGTDLYFTTIKEDGSFGLLQNMGKTINSAADEGMCQLLSDTKTLLFSSNGFSGYGDYDIYVTYRLDDSWKNWTEPLNLGSIINSNNFDGLPFYDESDEVFYFISMHNDEQVIKSLLVPKVILVKE
jgi:hypothetical protein